LTVSPQDVSSILKEIISQEISIMKKSLLLISFLLAFSLFAFLPSNSPAKDLNLTNVPVQIYFSPQGGCTEAIVAELDKAKSEIQNIRNQNDNGGSLNGR
jgi:hypothetical protein